MGVFMRPLPIILATLAIVIGMIFSSSVEYAPDPPELLLLRQNWKEQLKKEHQLAQSSYVNDLTILKKRLHKKQMVQELEILETEIKHLQNNPPASATVPSWETQSPLPGIQFARKIYQRKMAEITKRKNASYERALEQLKNRYQKMGDSENVSLIKQELLSLQKQNDLAALNLS